ncbi:MAG: hypothetical protein ACXQT5_00630 [Candidatus Syntropharchaeia archaeon]
MVTADITENDLTKINVGKSTVHYWIDRFKDILDSERKEEKARIA